MLEKKVLKAGEYILLPPAPPLLPTRFLSFSLDISNVEKTISEGKDSESVKIVSNSGLLSTISPFCLAAWASKVREAGNLAGFRYSITKEYFIKLISRH